MEDELTGGLQDPSGMSFEEYYEALNESVRRAPEAPSTGGEPTEEPAPQESPVESFWKKLSGAPKEIGRSMARGAVMSFDAAEETVSDLTGLNLDLIQPEKVDQILGKRSDDFIASFAESATQFAVGFAATGRLGVVKRLRDAGRLAQFGVNAARGAVADFAFFDPDEGGLAELAERSPVPIVNDLGALLSPDEDDSGAEKRLKRSLEGVMLGSTIDGIVAAARRARGLRVLRDPKATPEAREAAVDVVEQAEEVLQGVAEGTHRNPEDAVRVVPNEDGTFSLRSTEEGVTPPESPKFSSRGEAEAQGAVINSALQARRRAAEGFSEEDISGVVETFQDLMQTKDLAGLREMVDQTGHFNVSYMMEPEQVTAMVQAVSMRLKDAIDAAQGKGGVPIEESFRQAREALAGMTQWEAPQVIADALGHGNIANDVWTLMGHMVLKERGADLARRYDLINARPHDVVANEEARLALEQYMRLEVELAGSNSTWGRQGRLMQERQNPLMKDFEYGTGAAKEAKPSRGQDTSTPREKKAPDMTAGMSHRDIRTTLRMIKMADGDPRNIHAVKAGVTVIQAGSNFKSFGGSVGSITQRALQVFINNLLSHPITHLTALNSGVAVSAFETANKMIAGTVRGAARGVAGKGFDFAQTREGADILAGQLAYLGDGLKAYWATMKKGQSTLDPRARYIAWGGHTEFSDNAALRGLQRADNVAGTVFSMSGRNLAAMDEAIRTVNYRAIVRAKSLRIARQEGLEGPALAARVEEDLRNAFDPETGIARLGEALEKAGTPTFSNPLDPESFGGGFQQFANKHPGVKFIAPFVTASVNIFKYAWSATPGINLLNRQSREIIKRGGEEAAELHTRSALAAGLFAFAFYKARGNELTGRGPSDPTRRALWLEDHQPYSLRIGDKWVSYYRTDPLGLPLGMIADYRTMVDELGEEDLDTQRYAVAVMSALTANLAAKRYLTGITEFSKAWAESNPWAAERWIQNFASSLAVPNGLRMAEVGPLEDPYYREVRSVGDAIMARVPGWSDELEPRFNAFGEMITKPKGYFNRNLNTLRFAEVGNASDVEEALASIETAISPPPEKEMGGKINLADRKRWAPNGGKSPYRRWMELHNEPKGSWRGPFGGRTVREDLENYIKSPQWERDSAGTIEFPGGQRAVQVQAIVQAHRKRAKEVMVEEFPELKKVYRTLEDAARAARFGGQAAQDRVFERANAALP